MDNDKQLILEKYNRRSNVKIYNLFNRTEVKSEVEKSLNNKKVVAKHKKKKHRERRLKRESYIDPNQMKIAPLKEVVYESYVLWKNVVI